MKYYKYQIKVLNEGTADQVTLGLNTSENVNNFVAKDRLNEFSYFSVNDENAAEFISQNHKNLGISEISESEFNEAIKNTFTYERINEVLEEDKKQKAAFRDMYVGRKEDEYSLTCSSYAQSNFLPLKAFCEANDFTVDESKDWKYSK